VIFPITFNIAILIKQLRFINHFYDYHHFKTVNYGTLLAYVTVRVQIDLSLPQLQ